MAQRLKNDQEEIFLKNVGNPKSLIVSFCNLILEILTTYFIFNSIIVSIFKISEIDWLQSLGLVFAVSWVKLDVSDTHSNEDMEKLVYRRAVYYATFCIIALITYVIKRYFF